MGREDEVWDSSFKVLRREFSFFFRIEYWIRNKRNGGDGTVFSF